MRSILEQTEGSVNQRGETCRLRPRLRIGTAIIGRQEVGIPGILRGLIIREFFSDRTSFGWPGDVQRITERTALMFHSRNTRGSRLRIAVSLKQLVIPASCLTCCRTCHRTLLHDLLSPTSPVFRPSSPSLSCPTSAHSGLDQETLRDSQRNGGYTKSASPTCQAGPLPRQDGTAVDIETVAHRPQELQAAGSSPSRETVMQSLKTVTGGIRDLNTVHEITDLLAPNDPGKLCSAIERKPPVGRWWTQTPVSTTAQLERERVPKVVTEANTAQRFPVNTSPRALVLEETSADSHTRVWISCPAASAAMARKRTGKGIGARSVEKSRIRHIGQNRVQIILPLLRKLC